MQTNIETQYLELLKELTVDGVFKKNRTGVDTKALFSRTLRHNMDDGFPLLTTKKMAWNTIKVELEGFIKGITSKKWFQDRGCHIWDGWCNPQKVPYSNDQETLDKMAKEDDLGPCIYGGSWRNFHDPLSDNETMTYHIDQLKCIIGTLNSNPDDRRMVCMAWNPLGLRHTALPPCHMGFLVNVLDGKLNLSWWQRSADAFLGIPFNIASYALLLHLLAKEAGLQEGELVGHFEDVHIYTNHLEAIDTQLHRIPYELPGIASYHDKFFDWKSDDTIHLDYMHHPSIKAPVAI